MQLRRTGRRGTREFLWRLYSGGEDLFEGLKIMGSTRQTWKFQGRSLARVLTAFHASRCLCSAFRGTANRLLEE